MKINIPKTKALHELLLMYGEDWVKERFNISGDKIDELLYGDALPTRKRQDRLNKKRLSRDFNWTKYNDDIDKIMEEYGYDIELMDVSILEDIAMKYQQKNGVVIRSGLRDRFIWDSKDKVQLMKENKVYVEENADNFSPDIVGDILSQYYIAKKRIYPKSKYMMSDITSKTKEDCLQDHFLKVFEKKYYSDIEQTLAAIHLDYKRMLKFGTLEMYVKKDKEDLPERGEYEGMIYIIRCWNRFENFYKLGFTSKSVNGRFLYHRRSMPYKFEIIYQHVDKNALKIEQKFHKDFEHKNKYFPKMSFAGKTECYKNNPQEDFEKYLK